MTGSIYTQKIYWMHLLIIFFAPIHVYAKQTAENALNSPVGSLASHIGLGVASNGDSSVVDINPALLPAIPKQYSLFGNFNFNQGFDLYEVGIIDTISTSISAVLKARQTTPATSQIDRRITLGLAYLIPDSNLSIGITGYYNQYHLTNFAHSLNTGASLTLGTLYQINFDKTTPLFLGFSVTNLFDKFQKTAYNVGASKGFLNDFYTLHIDGTISNKGILPKIAGGIDIKFREFFYLRGSLGWNFEERVLPWGVGIFFNGPRLQAFYVLSTHQANSNTILHSVGIALTF